MKIDPPSKSGPISSIKQVSAKRTRGRTPSRGQTPVSDDVSLTDQATLLGDLESQLTAIDTVDAAMVEAVQKAIREGNYKVDQEKVAENLIKESVDLIHSQVKP